MIWLLNQRKKCFFLLCINQCKKKKIRFGEPMQFDVIDLNFYRNFFFKFKPSKMDLNWGFDFFSFKKYLFYDN